VLPFDRREVETPLGLEGEGAEGDVGDRRVDEKIES